MSGIAKLPGFAQSLRLLVERERYSLHDIGLMFGVSHQRIDQLCDRFGIRHPDRSDERGRYAMRIWDDREHRFRPVVKRVLNESRRQRERAAKRAARNQFWRERRQRIVVATDELRARLGRAPTWQELASSLGLPVNRNSVVYLAHQWDSGHRASMKARLASMCRALNVPHLKPGHRRRQLSAGVSSPTPDQQ
jgi:hypothetical protein